MKKTITALAMILILSGQSQTSPAALTIHGISRDTVFIGDTISIYFTYTVTAQTSTVQFNYFTMSPVSDTNNIAAWGFSYLQFPGFDSETYNGIACKVLRVVLSANYPKGLTVLKPGNFSIYYMLTTGLRETTLPQTEPEYYNLQGDRVEFRYNEVLFERRGTTWKKVWHEQR